MEIHRPERVKTPRLTEQQAQRGLAVVEALGRLQAEQLARRGALPTSDSVEIIHQMREERVADLLSSTDS